MQESSARVLIVDSHPIIRDGLESLLRPVLRDSVIVGSAGFADALRRIERESFDLIVSDFRIMGDTVLTFLETLRKSSSKARCLVFSDGNDKEVGYPSMLAGASGFVSKSDPVERVVEAAQTVLNGRQFVSHTLARMLKKPRQSERASPAGI